ncbi:Helix-turn-helix domain-containing protein [Sinosporangium album]|uniref:Helix-turn-helix domain-containing protein n=1 Tax=Sinosporangium album TaxID=504805 RepID=A0A1G8IU45_9ACTN|nr:helix-turn-helix transcriptional regulator [Sinosporangium album]SDI22363.1 Helix-turn-helix domain-containing protein [Sinosporangium album]
MITAHADNEPRPHSLRPRPQQSSTVLRILLGAQLRRLREARQITLEDAGHAIRASHSKISRMELGRVGFRPRDVADLLSLYGVTDEADRDGLLTLVAQANAPGWWHNYSDVLPSWFETYVGLEGAATSIRNYEVQFVPGLLQTEDYARAVVGLGFPDGPADEVERRVRLRMARRQILDRPDAPHLWVLIDEAVLRRPLGGPEVMRKQVRRLVEDANRPNVTVQVIPFSVGGHSAAGGPFSVLRFDEPDLPDVIYLEQLTSSVYLDKQEDSDSYLAVMERLCIEASSVEESRDFLLDLAADI